MITESAVVTAVEGDKITVEAAIKTTCGSCQAQSDCGSGVISRALAPKTQQLIFHTPQTVAVGQQVTIGIPEQGIVAASAILYIAPLVVMLASALALSHWLPMVGLVSELWVLAGSTVSTLISYVVISGRIKRLDQTRFAPVLLTHSEPSVTEPARITPKN